MITSLRHELTGQVVHVSAVTTAGRSPERAALGEELNRLSHAVFDMGGRGSEVADPTGPITMIIAVTEIDPEEL